jgi:hypothetical protein
VAPRNTLRSRYATGVIPTAPLNAR